MKSKSSFMAVALWILSAAVVAADKPLPSAPNFRLKDANGQTVSLTDFKGKVVLLNFWATWCHGCKKEVPWFAEFEKKYGPQGFVVLGVSMDDDGWKVVTPFVAEKKLNYPVVIGDAAVAEQYKVEPLPQSFLINRDGKIAATFPGVVDRTACEKRIGELLRAGV
jgi:cytochrome c biogenesis protein CcmG/thiol:disulfide interchange protein DsbE